jgi:HEAT repeat protein
MGSNRVHTPDSIDNLSSKIEAFKAWAKTLKEHSVDWELEYPDWDSLYQAVYKVLANIPLARWNSEVFDELLYALARDNETENIADKLPEHPKKLVALANKAITYPDYQARWQIAHALYKISDKSEEAKNLLTGFASDENEYVRKRALLALDYLGIKPLEVGPKNYASS